MDSLSQMTQEQKQVRQQLSTLQNWKSKKFTPERLRERHMKKAMVYENEYNHKFVQQVQENIPAAEASGTASGITVRKEMAAKESYKEKKERQKKDKEAKKANPKANHISYDIKESLRYYDSYYNNGLSALPADVEAQCQKNQIDKRVLKAFSKGHRVNKKGQPEDEIDLQEKQIDLAFYSDYSSGELSRRIPHLQRMVKEVLESPLTVDWFTVPMMKEHAGAVKNQIDRLILFSVVQNDPVNAPFFNQLSSEEKGLLYIQTMVANHYEGAFKDFLGAYSVDYRTGKYLPYKSDEKDKKKDDKKEDIKEPALSALKKKVSKSLKEKYETIKEMNTKKIIKETGEQADNRELKDELNLPYYMNEYSVNALSVCRNIIEQHSEEYAKNRKLINNIYQDVYRCVDLLGDHVLNAQAATSAIVHLASKVGKFTFEEEQMEILSVKDNEYIQEQIEALQTRIRSCTDALSYLVGETKLSPAAAFYLEKMTSGSVG